MSNIRLYHGTIADFNIIDLKHCKDKKDFGKGFYTTTDINQAIKLARRMKSTQYLEGNVNAKAYVYEFIFDKELLSQLSTHNFQNASLSWIDYILKNRYSDYRNQQDYDVVIGKVADVIAKRVMNQFVDAYGIKASKENKMQLINKLEPYNLIDQYCFKTDRAIAVLNNTSIRRKEY